MSGAVFFVALAAVILLVAVGMASPIFIIPVVVIGLTLLFAGPLLAMFRGSAVAQPDPGPKGVPSTHEAAYQPQQEPTERGATN